MAKQQMVKFNVKNVKYAVKSGLGVYGTVKDLAYAESLNLEADYNETKLYGDGYVIGILGNDKGKTGTLGVINIEDDYEVDCGRALLINGGIADVQQRKSVRHAIYYEIEAFEEGQTITIKNWLFGCITGKPNESYEQTKDDPTINTYEYPLTVLGENLLDSTGAEEFTDDYGNTIKVFRKTTYPGDADYDGFEDAVPAPKALSE